jgi:hypothetical protein
MFGTLTAKSGANLTVNVAVTSGTGTFASWHVALSGPQGIQGPTGGGFADATEAGRVKRRARHAAAGL